MKSKEKNKFHLTAIIEQNQPELSTDNNRRDFVITKDFVAPPKFGWN